MDYYNKYISEIIMRIGMTKLDKSNLPLIAAKSESENLHLLNLIYTNPPNFFPQSLK